MHACRWWWWCCCWLIVIFAFYAHFTIAIIQNVCVLAVRFNTCTRFLRLHFLFFFGRESDGGSLSFSSVVFAFVHFYNRARCGAWCAVITARSYTPLSDTASAMSGSVHTIYNAERPTNANILYVYDFRNDFVIFVQKAFKIFKRLRLCVIDPSVYI